MTIDDIIDELVLETGGDSDDTELRATWLSLIKAALRRFPRHAQNRMFRSKESGSLIAAAQTMNLPDGVVMVDIVFYESEGKRFVLDRPKVDRFTELYNSSVTGAPQAFIIRGNVVEFDRVADQAYTIYFESFVSIDDVAADDTWGHSSDRVEVLKDGAKWYYYNGIAEDVEKAAGSKTDFAAGLKELSKEFQVEEMPDHVEETES